MVGNAPECLSHYLRIFALKVFSKSPTGTLCSLGNGQASSLLHPLPFMFTCTHFTTTSSKRSKSLCAKHGYILTFQLIKKP